MSSSHVGRRTLDDAVRAVRRAWWRFGALVLLTGAGMMVALVAVASVAQEVAPDLRSFLVEDGQTRATHLLVVEGCILLALLLLSLPLAMAGMAATARLTDDALADRRLRVGGAFALGLRRAPQLLAATALATLATVALFVLSPVLTVGALLGLLLRPLGRRITDRWPTRATLVGVAIPFRVAFVAAGRLALTIPAGTLSTRTVRETLGHAGAVGRDRTPTVLLALGAAIVVTLAASIPCSVVGFAIDDTRGGMIARGFGQLLTLGLPMVVLTVVYRLSEATPGGTALPATPTAPYASPASAPLPLPVFLARDTDLGRPGRLRRRRVAVLLPVALVASLITGIGRATVAEAEGPPTAQAGTPVAMVVTSDSDDASTLAADQATCVDPSLGGRCTLRAAFAVAQAIASSGSTPPITITFASDLTIELDPANGALVFNKLGGEGGGAGPLTIDGRGHHVVIDGGGATRVMQLAGTVWPFVLQGLEITGGSATASTGSTLGGGVTLVGSATSTFDGVTFTDNFATTGAGALLNYGKLVLRNSTFAGNAIGPESAVDPGGELNGGAALYNGGTLEANGNTFGAVSGTSIYNIPSAPGSLVLANSLITATSTGSFNCRGFAGTVGIAGAANVVPAGDTSCPGSVGFPVGSPTVLPLQHVTAGAPRVHPLAPAQPGGHANPALGAGGSDPTYPCTSPDAVGRPRPPAACDAGAYQYDPATLVSVASSQNPSVFGDPVTFTATVALARGVGTPEGTVRLSVDGTPVGSAVALSGGSADLVAPTLSTGPHDIDVSYASSVPAAYANSATSAPLVQRVASSGTTVTVGSSANPSLAGQAVTLTVTAAGANPSVAPTGTVSITDTSTAPPTVLAASLPLGPTGLAQLTTSSLAVGSHSIVASYGGDGDNAPATSAELLQAVRSPSTATISATPTTSAFGQPVTVTVAVPTRVGGVVPTGNVQVTYDNATRLRTIALGPDGTGSAALTDLPVGTAVRLSATYVGDATYAPSAAVTTDVRVDVAATATVVSPAPTSAAYGAPVTLTATVTNASPGSTATPAGTVTFRADGATIGTAALVPGAAGTATTTYATTVGQLPPGAVAITATYGGAASFAGSTSGTSAVTVSPAATTTAIASDANPARHGQPISFTATVTPGGGSQAVATGSVTFRDGSTVLGTVALAGGTATLGTAALSTGSHAVVAAYQPGERFQASTSAALTQVVQAAATTTAVATSSPGPAFGTPVVLTVDVAAVAPGAGDPVGTVVVAEGGTTLATAPLVGGSATIALTGLAVGPHTLTATYSGATDFGGSSGSTTFTVAAAATTTDLAISPSGWADTGKDVTLTATVTNASAGSSAAPVGAVVFTLAGTVLGTVPVTSVGANTSRAVLTTSLGPSTSSPQGQHRITATFRGGTSFGQSSDTEAYTVRKGTTSVSLQANADASTITATIEVLTGAGVPTGTVELSAFSANGVGSNLGTVALSGGVAVFSGLQLPRDTARVRATYSGDANFTAGAPAEIAISVPQVVPTLSLTGGAGPLVYGQPDRLVATVGSTGRFTPTGTVTFRATGPGGVVVLGTATPSATAPFRAVLDATRIPVGATELSASYGGDADLAPASATSAPPTITPAPTAVAVSTSLSPSPLGQAVDLIATVTNTATSAAPAGTVSFTLDGAVVGSGAVRADGTARVRTTPLTAGSLVIGATFAPDAGFAASSGRATQVVSRLATDVLLTSSAQVAAPGDTTRFTVRTSPAGATAHLAPRAPGGTVTVSDGKGHTCTITLVPDGFRDTPNTASGSCSQTWAAEGTFGLTASYAGDAVFAPGTSRSSSVTVTRRTPTLTLTSDPTTWVTGDPFTLSWRVAGPTSSTGQVTLSLDGTTTVCTSNSLVGSCSTQLPNGYRGSARFALEYSGDAGWARASTSLTQQAIACVPFLPPTAVPTTGGTAALVTSPNCNGGTGYRADVPVEFRQTTNPDYRFTGWSVGGPGEIARFTPSYPGPVTNTANYELLCTTVRLATRDPEVRGGDITSSLDPNCGPLPREWKQQSDGSRVGSFGLGTALTFRPVLPRPAADGQPRAFRQWAGAPAGQERTVPLTVTLTGPLDLTSVSGATCFHGFTFPTPAGGSANVAGGRTCSDERGDGYAAGTQVTVSTTANGTEYFTGWSAPVTTVEQSANSSTALVTITRDDQRIEASYDTCLSFRVVATGDSPSGEPLGRVSASPTGNCPTQGAGFYTRGTRVQISASTFYGVFNGWSGLPTSGSPGFADNSVVVTRSATQTASFYYGLACQPFTTKVVPTGSATLTTTFTRGNQCPAGMYDTSVSEQGAPAVLTTTPKSGKPQVGFSLTDTVLNPDRTYTKESLRSLPGATLEHTFLGPATVTAWTCVRFEPKIELISPNGTRRTQPLSVDADFIGADPLPNCPLSSLSYTVGTNLTVAASAPEAGYTFVGWSGGASGTEVVPPDIALTGETSTVPVVATYQVVCHQLEVVGGGVEVTPKPNCPDAPASENRYIAGTLVNIHATGVDGKKLTGWIGNADVDGIDAYTDMTKDTRVGARYEDKNLAEKVVDGVKEAVDQVGILAKKVVGVVAAVGAGLITGLNPVTSIAGVLALVATFASMGLRAAGVEGAGMDAFDLGTAYLSETLYALTAAVSCGTVWSANSSSSKAAADNVIGQVGQRGAQAYGAYRTLLEHRALDAADEAARKAAFRTSYSMSGTPVNAIAKTSDVVDDLTTRAPDYLGRVGLVAAVGYGIYQTATAGPNAGWDESAETAWTTGGDVYNRCLDAAKPSYLP